jgi:hypothetical protein
LLLAQAITIRLLPVNSSPSRSTAVIVMLPPLTVVAKIAPNAMKVPAMTLKHRQS